MIPRRPARPRAVQDAVPRDSLPRRSQTDDHHVILGMGRLQRCSDVELLRAARAGQAAAFACFYRRYQDPVVAYVARRVPRADLVADLTAETFTAALVAVHRRDFTVPDVPVAWLFAIARNKLLDASRRRQVEDRARREAGLEPLLLTDSDIQRIDLLTDEGRVLSLLERLPDQQRDAVRAYIIDDRTYPEIAADAHTSQMVIRQRVSRGLRRLRKMLEAQT